ncbi:Protein MAIN-LIKE 2 [Glycine max]|nr:Protein MAIN-LIKE 2 [Glycine max]
MSQAFSVTQSLSKQSTLSVEKYEEVLIVKARLARVTNLEGLLQRLKACATGLSLLIACSLDIGNMGLIYAFVERWHKEISSFHLPVGEVTITLDDVVSLLYLSITIYKKQEIRHFNAMGHMFGFPGCETFIVANWTATTRAYLLHLVGCTLFANKSITHVHVVFLDACRDLSQTRSYSWGAVALVRMYKNLNDESKRTCWIYKHFLIVVSYIVNEDYHERKSCASRWKSRKALPVLMYRKRLDRLTFDVVCWIPYGDHCTFKEFELISLFCG